MNLFTTITLIIFSYLIGSIPFGLIIVWLKSGKDITQIGSGRTGGTNTMRAGGVLAGVISSLLDLMKGVIVIWLAKYFLYENLWAQVFCGAIAVFGHNWSIWMLIYRNVKKTPNSPKGIIKQMSAGAGTGPNVGVAIAFWNGSILILIPIVLIFVFIIGYASLASIAVAILIPIMFLLRYIFFNTPYEFAIYGTITAVFVIIALTPNIRNLISKKERRVGFFAPRKT